MAQIAVDIPASLKAELDKEVSRTGRGVSSLVTSALAQHLEKPVHTVFQISTSGALVAGVYDREVSVQVLLEHGDFGLGTFANLDGEMVVVDGHVYQIQASGRFRRVDTRAPSPPKPGIGFVEASKAQSEFALTDTQGTLVGLWSPGFSSAFSVAGYHFHFLSADRQHGGHLLDVEADALQVKVEALTSFHLALPESEAFLKADLSRNTAEELAYAERTH